MTSTTSAATPCGFHLNSFLVYAAMAPLVLWHPANGAAHSTPVDLRPSLHFISVDGSPLGSAPRDITPSMSQVIESIEAQLSLSKAALADLLGVTRPALYAWMRGTPLRPQNAARLSGLKEAANLLTQAAGGALPALWQYQTLSSGECFADGMRAGGNPVELAVMLADQWRRNAADASLLAGLFDH